MHIRSLIDLDNLDQAMVNDILDTSEQLANNKANFSTLMTGKILCPVFLQESSRTYMNSTSSFLRMGGRILPLNLSNTRFGSAWSEPVRDFAVLLEACCDFAIARSPDTQSVREIAKHVSIPVLNAGNGSGKGSEHPIQALIDLFTIRQNFGTRPLNILMMGGKHIRTTRTQLKLFHRFGYKLTVMAPPSPVNNSDIDQFCRLNTSEITSLDEVDLANMDVIYHNGTDENAAAKPTAEFILTHSRLKSRGFRGKVMHSLPRKEELAACVDKSPYNLYFWQMANARFVFQSVFRRIESGALYA